jgi:chitinase
VLLSVGGAHSAPTFREIVSRPGALDAFAATVARIVAENGYNGIDLDWEPTECEEDRKGLVTLIHAFRRAARGALLSMAAPASDWYGRWWDVEALRAQVDFLNVMTYDFHGPWSGHAGHHAPLRGAPDDEEDGAGLCVESGMAYWSATRKWPPERLNVGIPCYGRGFAVRRWHQKPSGKAPHEVIAANEISALLLDGWRRAWDPKVGVPTLLQEGVAELISYEDAESAALKGAWAREKGYRGIFFWTIAQDWRDGDHEIVKAAAAAFRK